MRNFLFLPRKEVERQATSCVNSHRLRRGAVHKNASRRTAGDPCLSLSLFSLFLLSLRARLHASRFFPLKSLAIANYGSQRTISRCRSTKVVQRERVASSPRYVSDREHLRES